MDLILNFDETILRYFLLKVKILYRGGFWENFSAIPNPSKPGFEIPWFFEEISEKNYKSNFWKFSKFYSKIQDRIIYDNLSLIKLIKKNNKINLKFKSFEFVCAQLPFSNIFMGNHLRIFKSFSFKNTNIFWNFQTSK